MEFRVLGPVEVSDGGPAVTPTRAKERRVLAVLLAHTNQVVSAARLAEALWPGPHIPDDAVRSVHTHVSRLRANLGPASERLVTRSPGYLLRLEPDELDAQRFERLLAEARRRTSENLGEALTLLDQALELWRGPPYGEFRDEEFAVADAVRLEELRLVALEERIDARLALGHHEEAVAELEARCAEHPLRERLRGQLMLALYRSGRQPEALRAFDAYRRMLAEELGLDPSPELRDLETKILRHDPELVPRAIAPRGPGPVATPVSSFVGREAEVAEVSRRLAAARLLTVTGPGGVGKTRLALQVAAAVAERFPDGVVVCELAAVADSEAVAPAVATALGIQRRPDRTVADSVAEVLRTREMLLVVDNCEHVVDAAASLLSALVARCPQVTLLATSRERLAVEGEQLWPLRPLPVDAAVELFCDRARAVRPDLDCGGEARARIVELCGRLDGLPLAIELAAAQAAAMNPADLANRLDTRFGLLDRGLRSGPSRHRSLRAVVDWSYERLGEPQRRLFERLSVFAGSFTLEAAEQVCAGDGVERDVPQLVADLVEASLVTLVGGSDVGRYRLLETLRGYGREQLEREGGENHWRDRHADYYVELTRRADKGLGGADEGRWVRRLDAEVDDLRTAHRWLLSQGDTDRALELSASLHGYAYRTFRAELFSWAEAAAHLPDASGHRLLPLALGSAATGAWSRGDLAQARRLAEQGILAADGAPEGHLAFLALGGAVELFVGDLAAARAHTRQAAELAEAAGESFQAIVSRCTGTLALAYSGEAHAAIEQAEKVLVAARGLRCPSATAWAKYQLGEVLLDLDPSRALSLLDETLELAAGVGNTFLFGVAGVSATTLRARHGDPQEALRRFPELIDLWDRAGNWTQQWVMLRSLVTTLVRLGRDEPAAVLYGALSASPTAAPIFGADAERLARAVETMERRAGRGQVGSWVERGRHLGDDEVVELARAAASG